MGEAARGLRLRFQPGIASGHVFGHNMLGLLAPNIRLSLMIAAILLATCFVLPTVSSRAFIGRLRRYRAVCFQRRIINLLGSAKYAFEGRLEAD